MPAIILASILAILLCSMPSLAAFRSASDGVDPQAAFNPHPAGDDIVLPMPCGLGMVLKAVEIPGGLLQDRSFRMGIVSEKEDGRKIYERRFTGHISAPFTKAELPPPWLDALDDKANEKATWYFIGKYEVSRLQWQAVMSALNAEGDEDVSSCPTAAIQGANLPMTDISWFQAQDFLARYNAWLVKNHSRALPAFAGSHNLGFLRLPTEEEWEYAARGGTAVPPEWWEENDLFPMEDKLLARDFGVFNSGSVLSGPAAIGSRHPNPLGIHDVIGNAREMVDGFFRFSVADMQNGHTQRRLHGSAGGIITKRGSFRSDETEILPGVRDEMPLFNARGPGKASDLGFRVVLGALNVPAGARLESLRAEENSLQSPRNLPAATVDPDNYADPIQALSAIAANGDEQIKKDLEKIKNSLEERESARAAQNSRQLERAFRSLLYQAETLRAFAYRYVEVQKEKKAASDILARNPGGENRKKALELEAMLGQYLADYLQSLQMGANYYKSGIAALCQEPPQELETLYTRAKREYGGAGVFNEHMRQNLRSLEKFTAIAMGKGVDALSQREILEGIIPERHFKAIQFN